MFAIFTDALRFGFGILIGGVVGYTVDSVVGLFVLYSTFVVKQTPMVTAVWASVVGTLLLSVGGFIAGAVVGATSFADWNFTPAVVMTAGFTAMPTYRSQLKKIVTDLSAPIINEITTSVQA